MTDEAVVMGVLGTPMEPDREPGEDFGAMSDIGEPCKCGGRGVDSEEGTVIPAGDVTAEEFDEGASLGWGEEAARRCACCCCETDP